MRIIPCRNVFSRKNASFGAGMGGGIAVATAIVTGSITMDCVNVQVTTSGLTHCRTGRRIAGKCGSAAARITISARL